MFAGKVIISRKAIAQLIGRVFIQKAAVNLLSTVLDTPEFFWSAPDSLQTTYKKVCEYMELEERVEVLNNRFSVRLYWDVSCSRGVSGGMTWSTSRLGMFSLQSVPNCSAETS